MTEFRSEIRDSIIRKLAQKVKESKYGHYLRRVRLTKVRAFQDQRVDFDFPVTALIGTNGGGKSTILGAAAIAYKAVRPAIFFPKSFIGDETMSDWSIGYEIIAKEKNASQPIQRSAKFKRSKWVRADLIDREVKNIGIQRTVPAGERTDFKKLATVNYKFSGTPKEITAPIREEVERILGKDISKFQEAEITSSKSFYIGGDGKVTYSEFHFGAGESSVIRMVTQIESLPENSLVLIEEIENGLHPVAVRRIVEYLIDVADRKSIQSIFTTHSEAALQPLPPEAIWSSIDGKTRQGKISIEALRAITGRIDESLAIFVEDDFAREWVESIVRARVSNHIDEIGVYSVSGDSQAYAIHRSHQKNPAIRKTLKSICILDGDSPEKEDTGAGVIKLPGDVPESEVFSYVASNIDTLSMRLSLALHLQAEQETHVSLSVRDVNRTNRDPHLLFNQVGQQCWFTPTSIVSSAFIGLWMAGNEKEVSRIADFIRTNAERRLGDEPLHAVD